GTRRRAVSINSALVEQDRRQAPPLRARPGIFEADRLQYLEQPLARRALVPVAVAADTLQELAGGALAVALRHQRAGQIEPRRMVVGIGGDPRFERARLLAGGRRLGERQSRAGAG